MKLPIADGRLRMAERTTADRLFRRRHSSFFTLHSSFRRAFTLIEIMVVVCIIGLLAAMGLPSLSKMLQKEGMRKAVSDVEDVCFSAREQAIFHDKKVAVVFYPNQNRFGVEGTQGAGDSGAVVNVHSGKTMVATLPDGITFGMLDIFRQNYVQSDWAKVFFNPDGTCDEAVIVLLYKGQAEKITLEYATGMPTVSAVDQ
jgi:prepilin-type N-terminal cleavage/methylation domain-containing protein